MYVGQTDTLPAAYSYITSRFKGKVLFNVSRVRSMSHNQIKCIQVTNNMLLGLVESGG